MFSFSIINSTIIESRLKSSLINIYTHICFFKHEDVQKLREEFHAMKEEAHANDPKLKEAIDHKKRSRSITDEIKMRNVEKIVRGEAGATASKYHRFFTLPPIPNNSTLLSPFPFMLAEKAHEIKKDNRIKKKMNMMMD
jgi:hypothetical protein